MSVVNIVFEKDRITCTSDTLQYLGNQAAGLCATKIHVAPNGAHALAGRGHSAMIDSLAAVLASRDSLDAADEALGLLLPVLRHDLQGRDIELHLLGWSARREALSVVLFMSRGGIVTRAELPPGIYLHPYPSTSRPPAGLTAAHLVKVALGQQTYARRLGLPMCIGGLVHLTEITRDGARLKRPT